MRFPRSVPRRIVVVYTIVGAAWLSLLASLFFRHALASAVWVLVVAVWISLGALAVGFSVGGIVALRKHRLAAVTLAICTITAAGAAVLTDWNTLYGRAWFALHRPSFDGIAAFAESRAGDAPLATDDGMPLPPELAGVSATGAVHDVGSCNGAPVDFVPTYLGIPDGAVGWIHLPCEPWDGAHIDGFGDPLVPSLDVGGGWWWTGS